jgi:hypothetical protein
MAAGRAAAVPDHRAAARAGRERGRGPTSNPIPVNFEDPNNADVDGRRVFLGNGPEMDGRRIAGHPPETSGSSAEFTH